MPRIFSLPFYNIGCKAVAIIFFNNQRRLNRLSFIHVPVKLEIPCAENINLVIFPGLEAFDHLKWTYDEAFEQLFGPGRGEFEQNLTKIQVPGGCPGVGDVEASI